MMALLLLFGGGFLFLLWTLYRRGWDRNLSASVAFSQPAAHAGEGVVLTETIENRKRLPVPVLEIGFRVEKGLSFPDAPNVLTSDFVYKRDIFSLLGMEKIIRRYRVDCERRGHYHISQLTLSSRSLLGGGKQTCSAEAPSDLFVYPARTSLGALRPTIESLLGEVQSSRRLYEDPFSFQGIRSYTPQDEMRRINWRASAKTQSLMVNTYSSVTALEADLYVDVWDPFIVKKERLTEEAISLALTLCEDMLRQGLRVGFSANAGEGGLFRLPPGSGEGHLKRISQYLTRDFEALPHVPFSQLLEAVRRDRGADPKRREESPGTRVFFFLSMNQEEENEAAIRSFLGKEEQGIWIIPVYGESPRPASSRGLLVLSKPL